MLLMRFFALLSCQEKIPDCSLDLILHNCELFANVDPARFPKCIRTIRKRVLKANGPPPEPKKSWMCPEAECCAVNAPGTDKCTVCKAELHALKRGKKKPLRVMSSVTPLKHIKALLKRKTFIDALARERAQGAPDIQDSPAWKELMALRKPGHHLMLIYLASDW